jgi:hypothetical protein
MKRSRKEKKERIKGILCFPREIEVIIYLYLDIDFKFSIYLCLGMVIDGYG